MSQVPNPDYKHNPDGDDRVPLPEDLAHLEAYGITAHRYGNHIFLRGAGHSTKILDEILRKRNNKESIVIAVTGPPGTGKTYFGMMLAMILDPKFHCTDTPEPDPREDHGQIAFTRPHILFLTGPNSPLQPGQCIELDETHFGVGARSWGDKNQQILTNYIAAIRSKGYILIIVVLHTNMLDNMIREYVINYEINVTQRGIGKVYRRWYPTFAKEVYKKRLGTLTLPMPGYEICNYDSCLSCKSLNPKKIGDRCITDRAKYERRKEAFLNDKGKQQEEESLKTTYHEFDEIIESLQGVSNDIPRKPNGTIHKAKCVSWLREMGVRVRAREESSLMDKIKNTYG